jgi:glutathione peroxidase
MSALKGRLFDRLRQFQGVSSEIQTQVTSLSDYLASDQAKIFIKTSTGYFRSIPQAIQGKTLIEKIISRLQNTDPSNANVEYAKKLAKGLLLSGVLTSYQENLPSNSEDTETFVIQDNELYVPFGKPLTISNDEKTVSSVREGAIQAGFLQRKVNNGFFTNFTGSSSNNHNHSLKNAYVVVNDQTNKIYVFENDLSRKIIEEINVKEEFSFVQFESDPQNENGILLFNPKTKETQSFFAFSKESAEEWLNSFLNAGAIYREAFHLNEMQQIQSFYDLKDYDMQGKEISMSQYKGKVILVVNVSSLCGLTPTNYPELVALDEKYRTKGLEILAFPCNQFANQEPENHEEIMRFVQKNYNCQFTFFEKADVNGKQARPVFMYLKNQLPGSFGNFIKWNFTKFLIDRQGQPYKRYAPKDLPFSFEKDIQFLLQQNTTTTTSTTTTTTTST